MSVIIGRCLCCGKSIEGHELRTSENATNTIPAAYDALVCRAHGNYGSTVYDPMDGGEFLEFLICDDCIKAKSDLINWVKVENVEKNTGFKKFSEVEDQKQYLEKLANEKKFVEPDSFHFS